MTNFTFSIILVIVIAIAFVARVIYDQKKKEQAYKALQPGDKILCIRNNNSIQTYERFYDIVLKKSDNNTIRLKKFGTITKDVLFYGNGIYEFVF